MLLWICLPWISLIWGAAYSCWGALLAAPESSDKGKRSWFSLRSLVRRPLLANLICFLLPVIQSISVLIPAILAEVHWSRALSAYQAWEPRYASANALSRDMLLGSQDIYDQQLRACYYVCVTFTLWTLWASLFFLIYTKIVFGLFVDILRHSRLLSSNFVRRGPSANANASSGRTARFSGSITKPAIWRRRHSVDAAEQEKDEATPDSSPMTNKRALARAEDYAHGGITAGTTTAATEDMEAPRRGEQPCAANDTDTVHFFSRQEVAEDLPHSSFFPAVKPSKVIGNSTMVGSSSRNEHARMFRRLLVNFGVQFTAINMAILVYTGGALYVAVTLYTAAEQDRVGRMVGPAILAALWAAVVFGAITLIAIALRTYEAGPPTGAVSEPTGATPRINGGAWAVVSNITEHTSNAGDHHHGHPHHKRNSHFRFTRATKKATQLAEDQSIASNDGERSLDHNDEVGTVAAASSAGHARASRARDSVIDLGPEEEPEQMSISASVARIDHFAYPKQVPAHELLTPEAFQAKPRTSRQSRNSSSGVVTPSSTSPHLAGQAFPPTAHQPLAPRRRDFAAVGGESDMLRSQSAAETRRELASIPHPFVTRRSSELMETIDMDPFPPARRDSGI